MNPKIVRMLALGGLALAVVLGAWQRTQAQDAKGPYPSMAPLEQYLIAEKAKKTAPL